MHVQPRGTTIVWFRRDLRTADHPALRRAAERGPLVCLFIVDPALLGRRHHDAPARRRFLRAGLEALDADLRQRGSGLTLRHGDPVRLIPQMCAETDADLVVATREISPLGRTRDERVSAALDERGVALETHGGDLLAEPDQVPGPAGQGYRVFTPFYRFWREIVPEPHRAAPERLEGIDVPSSHELLDHLAVGPSSQPAGAHAARARLVEYIRSGDADGYAERRNDLAGDHTSGLSPYLRFGMCTAGQVGRALGLPGELPAGRDELWRQVAWREFFHHLLARNPGAAREAWREGLRAVRWDDHRQHFDDWVAGRTGFPLVDAAMRQLAGEGRMHNRTRMVAASFLVKDLLIDWRRGETHFMRHLIDGDPANNNGGWQWVAGTGADAAPYFRVMNPILQSKKFDPDGDYIRRHVPELSEVPARFIHEPWRMDAADQRRAACVIGRDYPEPIVDHADRRAQALDRYRAARGRDYESG